MVGHKFRKHSEENRSKAISSARKEADVSSAHDLMSYVGNTKAIVAQESELAVKNKEVEKSIRHAERTSDHLHIPHKSRLLHLAGIAAAAYIAASPIAFAGQSVHESGYRKRDAAVISKFIKNNAKYSSKGENVTGGIPTDEVVGIVDINRLSGYSSERLHGGKTVNGASVQLNTYVHIVSNNGVGQWLWVQDGVQIFMNNNRGPGRPSYTYGSISEIFRDSLRLDTDIVDGKSLTQKNLNSLKLRGISGRGGVDKASGIMSTYLFADYAPGKENGKWTISSGDTKTSNVIRFALDVKVTEKQDLVHLNFGIVPFRNGSPDWVREVTFDTVSYKVKGLKSARIAFNKLHDTGLVVAGIGGGSYFHAKKISGSLNIYEKDMGRLAPLKVSGISDWSTGEGAVGVHSVKLNSYTVELITAKSKQG